MDTQTMIPNSITDRIDSNDRGVSPVIGVILMVAITVILAAVIGTFVLDLGQSAGNSAPSASLTVTTDTSSSNVTISHKGGDSLAAENTKVVISGDGNEVVYESGSTNDPFSVGDKHNFNTTADQSSWSLSQTGGSLYDLSAGTQYDVQIIDTESQRVIFETTVTA